MCAASNDAFFVSPSSFFFYIKLICHLFAFKGPNLGGDEHVARRGLSKFHFSSLATRRGAKKARHPVSQLRQEVAEAGAIRIPPVRLLANRLNLSMLEGDRYRPAKQWNPWEAVWRVGSLF